MLTIDRIEDKFAICEKDNREMIKIEIYKLPKNIKEGDVIEIINNKYIVNKQMTDERKKNINNEIENLWK